MRSLIWHGCYDGNHKDLIVPEAYLHPAKMAVRLCERIFDYGFEQGYWQSGDLILDPFGGIATTALVGAYRGYRVVCVELEERFVELARKNIALNRNKLKSLGRPEPVIIQGDSRHIAELLREVMTGAVTSPPYANSLEQAGGIDPTKSRHRRGGPNSQINRSDTRYGATPGQIGAMAEGSATSPETYWTAMRQVYTSMHQALRPGSVMAVVVKDYVKHGRRVPLCDRMAHLLEACGYEVLVRVRAMLVKEHHVGVDLFSGAEVRKKTERKSFFRRLAEKKGSPGIDWEEIIFARRLE